MPNRRVVKSPSFLEKAHRRFPAGGDAEGNASYELFEQRPLAAVVEKLSRDFEGCLPTEPGSPVRIVATAHVPLFPAMTFYAILLTDDSVEILDFSIDDDYFDLIIATHSTSGSS